MIYRIHNPQTGRRYEISDIALAQAGVTINQWIERKRNAYGPAPEVEAVDDLPARRAAAADAIWRAAYAYEQRHGAAGAGVAVLVEAEAAGIPEAAAVRAWIRDLWDDAFQRIAQAMASDVPESISTDFTRPEKPCGIMAIDRKLRERAKP